MYNLGSPTSATGTIADNDDPPVVYVEATDATGAEQAGDTIMFTVTRTVNPYKDIVVVLKWSGQAPIGVDYMVSGPGGRSRRTGSS